MKLAAKFKCAYEDKTDILNQKKIELKYEMDMLVEKQKLAERMDAAHATKLAIVIEFYISG